MESFKVKLKNYLFIFKCNNIKEQFAYGVAVSQTRREEHQHPYTLEISGI